MFNSEMLEQRKNRHIAHTAGSRGCIATILLCMSLIAVVENKQHAHKKIKQFYTNETHSDSVLLCFASKCLLYQGKTAPLITYSLLCKEKKKCWHCRDQPINSCQHQVSN